MWYAISYSIPSNVKSKKTFCLVFSLCGAGVGSWMQPSVSLFDWTLSQTEGGLLHLWRETEQTSQSKVNTMLFPPFSFCRTPNLCYIRKSAALSRVWHVKRKDECTPLLVKYLIQVDAHSLWLRCNCLFNICNHFVVIKLVNVCVCLFLSAGTHRGCCHPAEELCRWRCLHSSLPQKVRFLFVHANVS